MVKRVQGSSSIIFLHSVSALLFHLSEWHRQALSCQPRVCWLPETWAGVILEFLPHGSSFTQLSSPTSSTLPVSLYPCCCYLNLGHHHQLLDCCDILLIGFPMFSLLLPIHFSCCCQSDFLKIKWNFYG